MVKLSWNAWHSATSRDRLAGEVKRFREAADKEPQGSMSRGVLLTCLVNSVLLESRSKFGNHDLAPALRRNDFHRIAPCKQLPCQFEQTAAVK